MNEFEKKQDQGPDKFSQQEQGGKPAFDQFGEKGQGQIDEEEAERIRQQKLQEAGAQSGQNFGGKGQQISGEGGKRFAKEGQGAPGETGWSEKNQQQD